jgi:hypothetical protein
MRLSLLGKFEMPPVVAWVGASLMMSGTAMAFGAFLLGAAQVIGYGLLIGAAYAMSERAKKKARAAYNAAQVDRISNINTTTGPRELVLGRVRKGGTIFFRGSVGKYKETFAMGIALAAHEVDGFEAVWLNDQLVTLDAQGYVNEKPYLSSDVVTKSVSFTPGAKTFTLPANFIAGTAYLVAPDYTEGGGEYSVGFTISAGVVSFTAPSNGATLTYSIRSSENSNARIRFYTGAPGQVADARLKTLFPTLWTDAHKLTGIAYAVCEFKFSETSFPSGIPVLTVKLRGAKCYDPRTGLTAFTENPALHLRHVLTHPNFGRRTSVSAAEDLRIIVAANACDTSHTYTATAPAGADVGVWTANVLPKLQASGVVGNTTLYRSGCVVPFGTTAADVFDDLVEAMAGHWAYAAGSLYLRAGVYTAPTKTFTEADLATTLTSSEGSSNQQAVSITTHKARIDKVNTVSPRFWDAAQDYKSVPGEPIAPPALVARDGSVLASEIQLSAVFSGPQAAHICSVAIRDARDALSAVVSLKLSGYAVEMFDTVALTIPRYGWVNKPFLVLAKTWSPSALVTLSLKETSPLIYQPDATFAVGGFAENTALPDPWDIDPPTSIVATSGTSELRISSDGTVTSNIRVSWAPVPDFSITSGGVVEVRYARLIDNAGVLTEANLKWNVASTSGDQNSLLIQNATDGITYAISARVRNTLAISEWSVPVYHLVVGKTAPPSNVTGATFRKNPTSLELQPTEVPDLDVAGYEVRTVNSGWGNGDFVAKGNSLSFSVVPYTVGVNTWFVRAYDTTGHYSLSSYSASYTAAAVPNVTAISSTYEDTSLTSATVRLSWPEASPEFGLDGYLISYPGVEVSAKTSTVTLPADWLGNRTFTVKTVDKLGRVSTGFSSAVAKLLPAAATEFKAQVIDNTVLLFWKMPAKTSLPIAHALIKKGSSWGTATLVGTKDGEFTTLTELAAGEYTYWLAVVDTEGEESAPVSLTTKVSQPPDFIFNGEFNTTFSGTKNNAVLEASTGYVYLPVNTAETFAQHFTSNSWTTPQAQIAAGYPYYPQPGTGTGYYEEVFDFGTLLASSNVSLNLNGSTLAGSVNITTSLSLSANGSTYTDYPGLSSVFGSNFRYVKVRVTVTQSTVGAIYEFRGLNVRLDAKLKSDAGSTSVTTAVEGTLFNFNSEFVDVVAITPSANGSTLLTPVCDFYDVIQTGTYSVTSGVCTVTMTGHKASVGARVRLSPSTGLMPPGVYTVATVPTANTFTFTVASANTSGNTLGYHNFGRLHLFNSAGARVAGTVSWAIRGF